MPIEPNGSQGLTAVAQPGVLEVELVVNETAHQLTLDSGTTLLDALREHFGLVGTKKGCDQGACGASSLQPSYGPR